QEEYYEATEASRQKLIEFKKELKNTQDSVEEVGDSAEEAGEQQTEAFEGGASIAAVLAGHYNAITAELQGMSSAAHDTFIAMQKGVGGVDTSKPKGDVAELKNELKETSSELGRLRHAAMTTFDVTGISTWMMNTAADAAYVKKQFLEQKIALEELFESYEEGELNSRNFVKQGERAADTMNLLNEQDLDKLNSAISSAEDGMAQLGDSSKDTLNSLQDELDQLQGRQDDISRRQYDNQRIDLKAQKAEAMAKGDQESIRNLTSALRLSEQVYNEKRRQAQQEKTKELQKNQVSKSAPSVSTGRQSPQKIIRLEYPGGGVNIGIDSSDEIKLLQALKNAGLKSV
ncbi:hypothetical protein, partial [Endozoicomonas sp.]|uniref:hypothetical protein n=1 Tax=Endozoicomonas sp. TaxID=1892382 RepID=UPI00383A4D8C